MSSHANPCRRGVNPTRDPRWSLDLNIFFPNFFVDVGHGTYFTYNFWPLAADRSLWEVRSYFPKAQTVSQRFSQEYSKVIFRDILTEDASTMEQTQQVLASGAKKEFILQDQELLVRFGNRGAGRPYQRRTSTVAQESHRDRGGLRVALFYAKRCKNETAARLKVSGASRLTACPASASTTSK